MTLVLESVRAAIGYLRTLVRRASSPSDRRVARQTFWLGSITAVQVVGGLVQIPITARMLGPDGFGILAVIIAGASLIYGLLAIPGGHAIMTFVTRAVAEGRPEEAGAVLRFTLVLSQGISLVAYAVIVILTLTVSGLLSMGEAHVSAMLLYGLTGILLATSSETMAVLRLADRVYLGFGVTLVSRLTGLGLIVVAWQTGGGLYEVVTASVVAAAVSGAGMLAFAAASLRRAGIAGFFRSYSFKVPSDIVRFHSGMFAQASLGTLNSHLDPILVSFFTGTADIGLYRAARRVIDTARQPFGLLASGVQPEYSKQWYSGQGAELRRTALRFSLAAFAMAVGGFGLLALFREPFVRLFLGEEFLYAADVLLILVPGALLATVTSVISVMPIAVGRVWPTLAPMIAGLAAAAVAFVILVPAYGAVGAAWARTVHYLVAVAVLLPFVVSILRESRYIRESSGSPEGGAIDPGLGTLSKGGGNV